MHFLNQKVYHFIDNFDCKQILKLNKNINLIFRNYNKVYNYKFYKDLRDFCKNNGYKIFLSNNYKIALKANYDGLYIPSFNKKIFNTNNHKKNFIIIGSAHNIYEIRQKERQGVRAIFLSPLFDTKLKKGLGVYKFLNLCNNTKRNVVILGGINKTNIKKLNLFKKKSFASINYLLKNEITC
jgi:thiamine-phosphate pyrophosphorylase